jgi:hypothetical protein
LPPFELHQAESVHVDRLPREPNRFELDRTDLTQVDAMQFIAAQFHLPGFEVEFGEVNRRWLVGWRPALKAQRTIYGLLGSAHLSNRNCIHFGSS